MITEETAFQSSGGIVLEGAVDLPGASAAAIGILCHAHPKMGGTMNAPLLLAVRDELVGRQWGCLRFNFRGVGKSQGAPGRGIDEVADVAAATGVVRKRFPEVPYALLGWSFGAAVALRQAAADDAAVACVAIAPAVRERPGLTAGLARAGAGTFAHPVLVVVGSNDRETPAEHAREWATGAGADYREVAGANHFFWAKYDQLASLIADWLGAVLERPASA